MLSVMLVNCMALRSQSGIGLLTIYRPGIESSCALLMSVPFTFHTIWKGHESEQLKSAVSPGVTTIDSGVRAVK